MERKIDDWGRVLFHGDDVIELLFQGHDITTLAILPSPTIDQYNGICVQRDKLAHVVKAVCDPPLTPGEDAKRRQQTWWIPEDYAVLDVHARLLAMCRTPIETNRVNMEMRMFKDRDLLPVLRLMCFLIDRWRKHGVLWGVGRGSSVASYCLYLIGVHRINSIHYGLDIQEFLK